MDKRADEHSSRRNAKARLHERSRTIVFAAVEDIGVCDIADLNQSTAVAYPNKRSGEPTEGGHP
jgi:hypothetical protein